MSIDNMPSPPTRQQGGALARALLSAFTIVTRYPVLLVLGLVTLVVQISYSGINNVTLPKFIPHLGVPAMLEGRITGAVISTFLLAETFLRIPFGWLSDRYGRGKMIVGAMLLTAPSFWLTGMVSSYLWLFPLRAWDGMMAAALDLSDAQKEQIRSILESTRTSLQPVMAPWAGAPVSSKVYR